jgi:hypothetical protein
MAEYPYLPDWLDRRTAEWCAELCDAMAARIATMPAGRGTAYLGAELCAISIRSNLQIAAAQRRLMVVAGRAHSPDAPCEALPAPP